MKNDINHMGGDKFILVKRISLILECIVSSERYILLGSQLCLQYKCRHLVNATRLTSYGGF